MRNNVLMLLIWLSVSVQGQSLAPNRITGREDSIRQKVYAMGLPVVEIKTINNEWPHYYTVEAPEGCFGRSITGATKVPGRITIVLGDSLMFDSGEFEEDVSGMKVNIRGNNSARMRKKGYKVKLQKKADMLRRGDDRYKDKNWVLLATQNIRADVGVKVSQMLNMPYAPAFEHVNLIFNNEYKGNYILMETIRRNTDCRINISKDGYLFEYDPYFWNEDVAVPSELMEPYIQYTFKYPDPDEITTEQIDRFTTMIRKVENSMLDGTYPDYVDVQSLATWIMAHELLGTKDWRGANHFLTKYDDSDATKVQMPCLWDFDSVLPDTTDWYANQWFGEHTRFYFKFMLNSDNLEFVRRFVGLYDEISPTFFDEIDAWLEEMQSSDLAQKMEQAVALDSIRWNEPRVPFGESIKYARKWFVWRKNWIDSHIDEYRQRLIPTGIEEVATDEHKGLWMDDTAFYNLQGQQLSHPQKGINIRNRRKFILHSSFQCIP